MKLLTFQAKHFRWKSYSKTLEEVPNLEVEEDVRDTIVVFLHAEETDRENPSVLRQTLKHIKWLANKRGFKHIVLHSFTHLGGASAPPDVAGIVLGELSERLERTGYQVWTTPFGYFCEWDLSVYGDSLAKVWKQIGDGR